ncbi:MAG: AraC family transcriptional regulator [Dokdonella sp.]
MHFEYEHLAEGRKREIIDFDRGRRGDVVRIAMGTGRGCVLYGKTAPVTLLVPLKGRLQVCAGDSTHTIAPGQLLVVEGDQSVQLLGRGPAMWVALLASTPAWRGLTAVDSTLHVREPVLLPGLHTADHLIRRGIIAMVRAATLARQDSLATQAAAASVAAAIDYLQTEFDQLIERCPGRTHAQRRAVFLRLHRVRNLMVSSCHLELDLAECARRASYSPCHFIRAFSAVYGETPHAVLVEQRLRRAHRLLNSSVLAITEVARISGFEDRCAFARSFKRRFGMTATDLRDQRHASLQAVA